MKRLLIVLVASLVLGLVGGVGRAWAGDLLTPPTPPSGTTPVQSATQTNSGTNTADQNAVSAPTVVNASPNVAIANGGSDSVTKSSATNTPSCNPCAGQGGNVTQNSGSVVNAPASNKAEQENEQSNGAGQSQTITGQNGCCSSDTSGTQTAEQKNKGENKLSQTAVSAPVVVNASPNVAIANSGDVNQNSGSAVNAPASNKAEQENEQSNGVGQSQTVTSQDGGCCSGDTSGEQSAKQENKGKNELSQTAVSTPVVVNTSPNVAIANWGDVNQNSGSFVNAPASNKAEQENEQSNALGQSQTVNGSGGNCCSSGDPSGDQSAYQKNWGKNELSQTAVSAPIVTNASPNVAFLNWGDVNQNSGSFVNAPASNTATQTNTQSNQAGQTQTVTGGGCESECKPERTNECKPECRRECKPRECQKQECKQHPCNSNQDDNECQDD